MKIILTETVDRVGTAGTVLNVKDGFARNYLIPKNFAIMATPGNLKKVEAIKKDAQEKQDQIIARYRAMADQIGQLTAKFIRRAEDTGHLFGSVSDVDVLNYLNENHISIHKSTIKMDKPIKMVGEYTVDIHFHNDIKAALKVIVENE